MASFDTDRIYLLDTELYSVDSVMVESVEKKEDGQTAIVLAKTCFSPQGGGQPSDVGFIEGDHGKFEVTMVRVVDDKVTHFGPGDDVPEAGSSVNLRVDGEKRSIYARLHSAGHALDRAMSNIGFPPERLKATKGYHFLDGPSVEYEVVGAPLTPEEISGMPSSLQTEMSTLIEANIETVVVQEMGKSEVMEKTGQSENDLEGYPETMRMVNVAGAWIPCSGTHVKSTSVIASCNITKVKKKKNTLKVSYTL